MQEKRNSANARDWRERKTTEASQISDTQKALILSQVDEGASVAETCRKAASQASILRYRAACQA